MQPEPGVALRRDAGLRFGPVSLTLPAALGLLVFFVAPFVTFVV